MSTKHCTKHVTCHTILKIILKGKYHPLIGGMLVSPLNRWWNWGIISAVQENQGSLVIIIHLNSKFSYSWSDSYPSFRALLKQTFPWPSLQTYFHRKLCPLFLWHHSLWEFINWGTLWLLTDYLSSTLHTPHGLRDKVYFVLQSFSMAGAQCMCWKNEWISELYMIRDCI